MKNRSVHIVSLGCPKNQVDAEVLAAILAGQDFQITPEPQAAEVIIINTCAFILPAKEEAIDEIFRMAQHKKTGALKYLVVTGCLPQRYGKALEKELPEVDLFLGISEVPNIIQHIKNLASAPPRVCRTVVKKADFLMNADHPRLLPANSSTTCLKIADGCSNRCTYCIIPAIRGKARSRQPDDILREAEGLAEKGVKEIILIAQDTTAYGRDLKGRPGLGLLLRELVAVEKIRWIRLLYTHPAHLTEDVLEIMASEEKISRYLDIPIQHIDDTVLKAMNRKGSAQAYLELIARIREVLPDATIRSTFLIGFPGESDADFAELRDFQERARLDWVGSFAYSREEGTAAYEMGAHIPKKTVAVRRAALEEAQERITRGRLERFVGRELDVLVEEKVEHVSTDDEELSIGRAWNQAPEVDGLTVLRGSHEGGSLVRARVIAVNGVDFDAVPVA